MSGCQNCTNSGCRQKKQQNRPIQNGSQTGHIHSFESFGTVDGPGIRFVTFLGGCPLRCQYCHNVDMQDPKNSTEYTTNEVVSKIVKNKNYYETSKGGATFSGGEPLMQPQFLLELLKATQKEGIHTTVDTSLHAPTSTIETIAPHTDLFMISLKHFNNKVHEKLTGVPNTLILKNIKKLSELDARIWFRFVLLPGITNTPGNIKELIKFCHQTNFEKIEILPYHTAGLHKWEKLSIPYELKDIAPPSKEETNHLKNIIRKEGFEVI